jgi:hypothetical protein
VSVESAVEEGLLACRTCHPPVSAPPAPAAADDGGVGQVESAVKPDEGAGDVWFAPSDEPETGPPDAEPGEVPEVVDDDEAGVGRPGGAEDAAEWTAGLPGPFPELVDNPWDAGDVAEDEVVVDLRSEQELMPEAGPLDLAGDPVSRRE